MSKHTRVFVNVVQSIYDRVGIVQECREEILTIGKYIEICNKLLRRLMSRSTETDLWLQHVTSQSSNNQIFQKIYFTRNMYITFYVGVEILVNYI